MNNRRGFSLNINDWPLAAKLTGSVLVLLIPSTILINAIILSVLQNSITTQIGSNQYTLAQSNAKNLGLQLDSSVIQLVDLSRNSTLVNEVLSAYSGYDKTTEGALALLKLRDSLWASARPSDPVRQARQNTNTGHDLRTFINSKPVFSNMIVTDKYSGLVAVNTAPAKFIQSSEAWWQAAFNDGKGAIYISPAYFDPAANLFTVTIAVPVIRPNSNEVIGVLHADLRLRNIVNQLADLKVGQTGQAMLLNSDGVRLDTTAGGDIRIPQNEWTPVLNNKTDNYYIGPFQTTQSLVAIAPVVDDLGVKQIDQLGWYVVIRQDLDEGLAAQRQIVSIGALIAAIGLIVVSFFTINAARSLVQPISALTNTARQAQGGNLEITAPVTSRDEVGALSEAFNAMIGEIRSFTGSLEEKVNERTGQLAAINEIAAVIAASLDINEVMSKTVGLIRDRLGYYHVSIFLLDEQGNNAIVRESTGEVGRILKERPHTLAVGSQSLIGYVTANRKPRIALDTRADSGHFKNPLLPNTRSEIALPLTIGETLFGALDVQSVEPNAFTDEDVAVLQNMANQVAIAINNARLFQQSQERYNEVSLLNRQYLGKAWETFGQAHPESVNLLLEGGLVNSAPELAQQGSAIGITTPILSGDGRTIGIPISLRDEIIGEFALSNPEGTTRWTQEDLTLVEAVVAQVALAVENARLLEETQGALAEAQRLARRERVISEITTKITYGADVKRILQIAADELRRATGSSRAVVKLTPQVAAEIQETA